jgi:hypothetical protein
MSKLYATLSNSAGKEVSLSSNERIEATVYEGNKKQYSVYIEWGDIGDVIDNDGNDLPESEKRKGSTVTVKEWRNEPEERRYLKTLYDKFDKPEIIKKMLHTCEICGKLKIALDKDGKCSECSAIVA